MAVTFDAHFEKGASGGTSPFSFVSSAGTVTGSVGSNSNRVLIAYAAFDNVTPSAVAMTWDGVAMTAITTVTNAGPKLWLFGLIAPATGAKTLSATWTGGATVVVIGGVSVYNADQATGWSNSNTATGTSTADTITITTTSGDMAVVGSVDNNAAGGSILTGTLDWRDGSFNCNYWMGRNPAVSGSTIVAFTLGSSVAWGAAGVNVKQTSSAILSRPLRLRQAVNRASTY